MYPTFFSCPTLYRRVGQVAGSAAGLSLTFPSGQNAYDLRTRGRSAFASHTHGVWCDLPRKLAWRSQAAGEGPTPKPSMSAIICLMVESPTRFVRFDTGEHEPNSCSTTNRNVDHGDVDGETLCCGGYGQHQPAWLNIRPFDAM